MSEKPAENELGYLLKTLIDSRALSLRRLSALTEIDTATISRIINGKRKANLHHLEKFSSSLGVPIATLLEAAGYQVESAKSQSNEEILASVNMIHDYLQVTHHYDHVFSVAAIKEKLLNYEQYAQTDQGSKVIEEKFQDKIEKIGSMGPFIDRLKQLFYKYNSKDATSVELVLIGSALLYFILPVDVIPDYLFPIGYLDDAIAVNLVANSLLNK